MGRKNHHKPFEIDELLEAAGYKWYMTLQQVMRVTGMTSSQVSAKIEPVEIDDEGDLRYRRKDVIPYVLDHIAICR